MQFILDRESHPYAVKPSATILIDALGIGPMFMSPAMNLHAKQVRKQCMLLMLLVKGRRDEIRNGYRCGYILAAPGDALEYSASAGGAAFIMEKENVVAEILFTHSYTSDTPDFWRREHEFYPRHRGSLDGTSLL